MNAPAVIAKTSDTISTTYPGGKGLLFQRLISLIPPHRVYIAAFAGYDAIARMKRPAAVNIAIDADGEALENLRLSIEGIAGNGVAEASPKVASVDSIVENNAEGLHRQEWRYQLAAPETAMLASTAKNGDTAATWQFIHTDALAWLAAYDWRGDEFLYCDPPYLMETRKQRRAIYRHEMSRVQHCRLLLILTRLPCNVMVSGYYSNLYAEAFQGWHTRTFETTTRGGTPATEWVWMNYPAPVALHDYRYLGDGFRERERIKRKKRRWVERLKRMDGLERQALLAAIEEAGL